MGWLWAGEVENAYLPSEDTQRKRATMSYEALEKEQERGFLAPRALQFLAPGPPDTQWHSMLCIPWFTLEA